ncbi:MAG: hypothetical protein ACK48U_01500 [Planctomyces sp.]|jgi:hypothetical protein
MTARFCAAFVDHPKTASIGCHHYLDEELRVWEVTMFFGRLEIIGGAFDGQSFSAGFSLDVTSLAAEFDHPPEIRWRGAVQNQSDELGVHLSLDGLWHGRRIWLRILSQPPAHVGAGSQLLAASGQFRSLW